MTERTITADEVTCPVCYSTECDWDHTEFVQSKWLTHRWVCADCYTSFIETRVLKYVSTELPKEST